MKKTDLEKHKAKKILGQLTQSGTRFGDMNPPPVDRREQRRLDQAAGLVPFATKLPSDLAQALRTAAETAGLSLPELLTPMLRQALAGYHATTATPKQEG